MIFIKGVIDNSILVSKKSKDQIVKQLQEIKDIVLVNDSYDYLLKMPIYSLTTEKIKELNELYKKTEISLKELSNSTIEDIWIKDLEEL